MRIKEISELMSVDRDALRREARSNPNLGKLGNYDRELGLGFLFNLLISFKVKSDMRWMSVLPSCSTLTITWVNVNLNR